MDIVCNNGVLKARRQSGLPLRYQQVEWLKADKMTTITGLKTKDTFDIYAKSFRSSAVGQYIYQADSGASLTTNTTAYAGAGSGNWRFGNTTANILFLTGEMVETRQNRQGVWFNGERVGTYEGVGSFTSVNDFAIAGVTTGGVDPTLQIYFVYALDGETLVLDAVPVLDLVDNVYGWYDKVSGNFYTNSEATYTAGSDISDPIEVYTDGTPEVLTVGGGNLLDPTTVPSENRYILSGTGAVNTTVPTSGVFRHSEYIPVEGGADYKLGMVYYTANAAGLAWYSDTDVSEYISGINGTAIKNADGIVTAPATAKYVRFSWHIEEGYDTDWEHSVYLCKVVDNTPVISEWQAYTAPQTASVQDLFAAGDYKDTQDIISGLVTRRCGVCVYDGTQTIGNIYISSTGGLDNGAIIIYPLAEETTEQVTAQELTTISGTNSISVESNISNISLEVTYLKKN